MDLKDVLITHELSTRKSRPVDVFAERRALNTIASRIHYGRAAILQEICEFAMTLCHADSSGISILQDADEGSFKWEAVAGKLASHLGSTFRHYSPCSVCLELGSTQLMSHPERYFEWMQAMSLSVSEGLLVPLFRENRQPYGTIWVVHHDEGRFFDREAARVMTALGEHASAALQIQSSRDA